MESLGLVWNSPRLVTQMLTKWRGPNGVDQMAGTKFGHQLEKVGTKWEKVGHQLEKVGHQMKKMLTKWQPN